MTPRNLLRQTADRFRTAGIPDPEYDASLLLSAVCGKSPLLLCLDTDTLLTDDELTRFDAFVSRRLTREPLQYILHEASFLGLLLYIDARVLIPRPETALLCEWALELLAGKDSPRVLDLCCGSGCIGLAVKSKRPDASVVLSDVSPSALQAASENARLNHLDVSFLCCDLWDGVSECFDMVLSNPPYIPTETCRTLQPEVLFEPTLALDGGPDGLNLYKRIVHGAPDHLYSGGHLLMELGIHQDPAVSAILLDHGFVQLSTRKDLNNIVRMIHAVRP